MRNKREYINFILIFIAVISVLLIIEYILLKLIGFNEKNFFLVSLIIILISIFLGLFLSKFSISVLIETNKMLDNLLKETLHELNIPVATILANIKLLKRKETDEKSQKRLDRIEKAAGQLLELYKDMDYYIKKEIQKVNYEVFNLKELIEERILLIEDIKNDIKIYKDLEDIYVKSDKSGFVKVIDNLLSNAIKYNKPNGYIKIVLKNQKLIIEDSGKGMDESELVKIFERYYRADDSQIGHGIGLNIVKSFCDEEKISISIESKKDIGTKIILNLKSILT
ncbi:sensor histidine kinase [Nitrosophilus kaiyonis]|uniref:sensor histidine kinase n=1 Tax=Nitrosophilus kaiyonis TaxID=2930200 RepID=UPI0024924C13|nr:HAMP domain-containing sensor histidine kinase [Nitrosophilus kaiyonis]